MHGFVMFMSFSSLLTHPTGQRYDIDMSGGKTEKVTSKTRNI